jgi:MYXO-CTERM domain-containing protein
VLRATNTFSIVRVGGDGTGQSLGRYRFVNNTFISNAGGSAVMRVFDGIESIEMHNNVFFATGGTVNVSRQVEARWVASEVFEGSNNWIAMGATNIPTGFRGTITGPDARLTNAMAQDYRPAAGSPLINAGVATTTSPAGRAFPRPLALPMAEPPLRALTLPGVVRPRNTTGVIDLGAFESGGSGPVPDSGVGPSDSGVAPPTDSGVGPQDASPMLDATSPTDTGVPTDGASGPSDSGRPSSDASSTSDGASADSGTRPTMMGGCGCSVPSSQDRAPRWAAWAVFALGLAMKRRRSAK